MTTALAIYWLADGEASVQPSKRRCRATKDKVSRYHGSLFILYCKGVLDCRAAHESQQGGKSNRPHPLGMYGVPSVRNGWKAVIEKVRAELQGYCMIKVVRTDTGLSFPDFEEGTRLGKLATTIAEALSTTAGQPVGSPLELLIGFDGYPSQFALWWDGYTCELGCSSSCDVDLGAVMERLKASGSFAES